MREAKQCSRRGRIGAWLLWTLALGAGVVLLPSVTHARSAREPLVIVPPAAPPGTPEYEAARALAEEVRQINRARRLRLESAGGAAGGEQQPKLPQAPPSAPRFLGEE